MAEDPESDNKEFEPTPRRLDRAREKGDVPKSNDLNAAAVYFGLAISLFILSGDRFEAALFEFAKPLTSPEDYITLGPANRSEFSVRVMANGVMQTTLVLLVLPLILGLVSIVSQNSVTFAPSKVNFDFSRLSLIKSLKNKFGMSGIFEWLKSFLKLIVFSVVGFWFLAINFDTVLQTVRLNEHSSIQVLLQMQFQFLIWIAVISFIVGCVDFIFQRFNHRRKLRMSRKEVQDETKESEGDPYMKQSRMQRGRDRLESMALHDVPDATVVITNPTHYAVALAWDRQPGTAPRCVAKGVDEMALAIRRIADENSVPVYQDPPTARALYSTIEIGSEIGIDQYQAVALAIRFADSARKEAAARRFHGPT